MLRKEHVGGLLGSGLKVLPLQSFLLREYTLDDDGYCLRRSNSLGGKRYPITGLTCPTREGRPRNSLVSITIRW